MPISRRVIFLPLLLIGTLLLTACPQRESISKVLADPGRYRNKEVGITGTVTDAYGALGVGAYEVDDGTGRIWVATQRGIPSRGSRIGAKGRVRSGFNIGGRSFTTILEESDRRAMD
jgi:hypothetical protein